MYTLLSQMNLETTKYITALPNSGYPHNVGNRMLFMNDNKKYFADKICDIANLGVDIVGGCCGTTPEYIKKISDKLEVTREKVFYNSEDNISVKKKRIKNNAFYKDKTNGEKLIAVDLVLMITNLWKQHTALKKVVLMSLHFQTHHRVGQEQTQFLWQKKYKEKQEFV